MELDISYEDRIISVSKSSVSSSVVLQLNCGDSRIPFNTYDLMDQWWENYTCELKVRLFLLFVDGAQKHITAATYIK